MIYRITSSDAIWFPVLGSITLGGLYSAFKYLNKDLINLYLGYYFNLMGIGSLSRVSFSFSSISLSAF